MHVATSTFKTKQGVSDEQFLEASKLADEQFLSKSAGFVRHDLLKDDDGAWHGIIYFDTADNARAALHGMWSHPDARALSDVIDTTTIIAKHYTFINQYPTNEKDKRK